MILQNIEISPGVNITLIDLPLAMEGYHDFFGVWLVRDEPRNRNIVVDVGPTSTAPLLVEDLLVLGVRRLDYILLTHIHLDHSGGLASLLQAFPSAGVAVHPKGKPHLVDPERLWKSSLRVIPEMAPVYGEPAPVDGRPFIPEVDQIPGVIAVDTPGHASHHRSYFYETPAGSVLFAGEAASTFTRIDRLVPGAESDRYMLRPASPPRFYIGTALESIEKLKARDASVLCYAHFGHTMHVRRMLTEAAEQIQLWEKLFREYLSEKGPIGVAGVDMDELPAFLIDRDPWLEEFPKLPADVQSREMSFMRSSAAGFLEDVLS
jgi:glyoxylase-like metal-dependent hydrolase (beta-lactamase superfamily II)